MNNHRYLSASGVMGVMASIIAVSLNITQPVFASSAASRFLDEQSSTRPQNQTNSGGSRSQGQRNQAADPADQFYSGTQGRPPQEILDMEINPDLYEGSRLFPGYRGFIAHDEEDGGQLSLEEMDARIDAMARRALVRRGDMGLTLNDLRLSIMFQMLAESPDPASIRLLRELIRETERAKNEEEPPEPVSQLVVVDRGLHSEPIPLTTTFGYVTEITFIDSAGNPWPYRDKILGNTRDFTVIESSNPQVAQNKLLFSTENRYRGTNFKVVLDGFEVAVTFQVIYDDNIYHDNLVIQVDGLHSSSERTAVSGRVTPMRGDHIKVLQNLAINIPPSEDYATRIELDVPSRVAQVWRTQSGELLLRTRNTLLLPSSPQGVWHGPGGFAAYRIGYWPIIQLANEDGQRIDVVIDR